MRDTLRKSLGLILLCAIVPMASARGPVRDLHLDDAQVHRPLQLRAQDGRLVQVDERELRGGDGTGPRRGALSFSNDFTRDRGILLLKTGNHVVPFVLDQRVELDADGQPLDPTVLSARAATSGQNLALTIEPAPQQAGSDCREHFRAAFRTATQEPAMELEFGVPDVSVLPDCNP